MSNRPPSSKELSEMKFRKQRGPRDSARFKTMNCELIIHRSSFIVACFCALWFSLLPTQSWAGAQENYKLENVDALSEKNLADGIRNGLKTDGVRLADSKGTPVCELWLRKFIPLKAGVTTANYGALMEGVLLGVLHFPSKGSDFRGQQIKPGYYTMRYEQIPQDGNHLGVAQQSDFILLSPVTADKELDAPLKFDVLVNLSRQASGSNHPAVFMMVPATASSGLQHTNQGYWIASTKTQAKPANADKALEFPLAIVLIGKTD